MLTDQIEYFVEIFGEEYRRLINDSLTWLDEKEPSWNLPTPMKKYEFLYELIRSAKKGETQG